MLGGANGLDETAAGAVPARRLALRAAGLVDVHRLHAAGKRADVPRRQRRILARYFLRASPADVLHEVDVRSEEDQVRGEAVVGERPGLAGDGRADLAPQVVGEAGAQRGGGGERRRAAGASADVGRRQAAARDAVQGLAGRERREAQVRQPLREAGAQVGRLLRGVHAPDQVGDARGDRRVRVAVRRRDGRARGVDAGPHGRGPLGRGGRRVGRGGRRLGRGGRRLDRGRRQQQQYRHHCHRRHCHRCCDRDFL